MEEVPMASENMIMIEPAYLADVFTDLTYARRQLRIAANMHGSALAVKDCVQRTTDAIDRIIERLTEVPQDAPENATAADESVVI
jgi:CBS-domain-containing membrane protein